MEDMPISKSESLSEEDSAIDLGLVLLLPELLCLNPNFKLTF